MYGLVSSYSMLVLLQCIAIARSISNGRRCCTYLALTMQMHYVVPVTCHKVLRAPAHSIFRIAFSMPRAIISPSVLASDFGQLSAECKRMIKGGAEWLHMGELRRW